MAGIAWLTCPACTYRFYILEEEAGFGNEWFCPRCQRRFTEAEADEATRERAASPQGTIGAGQASG